GHAGAVATERISRDREGGSGRPREDAVELPSPEDGLDDVVAVATPRNLPKMAEGQHMLAIPIQRAVVGADIERIQQKSIGSCITQSLRPSICRREAKPLSEALVELNLESVVIAGDAVVKQQRAGRTRIER